MASLRERFESKFIPVPESGCWLWLGALNGNGYAMMKNERGVNEHGHRIAFRLYRGPIPAGEHVLHGCDVRPCVNPWHTHPGSHQQNMAERNARERQSRGETHGPAKLCNAEVLAIRSSGGSQRAIARRFGISRRTVRSIKDRNTWRHL